MIAPWNTRRTRRYGKLQRTPIDWSADFSRRNLRLESGNQAVIKSFANRRTHGKVGAAKLIWNKELRVSVYLGCIGAVRFLNISIYRPLIISQTRRHVFKLGDSYNDEAIIMLISWSVVMKQIFISIQYTDRSKIWRFYLG